MKLQGQFYGVEMDLEMSDEPEETCCQRAVRIAKIVDAVREGLNECAHASNNAPRTFEFVWNTSDRVKITTPALFGSARPGVVADALRDTLANGVQIESQTA